MDLSFLSNTWGYILIALLFGGSIFIHELGHFVAAKAFGLKILRFSIGFGPRLFQWKGRDGCKYIISLLPLGGYVAIPQLVDLGKLEGEEQEDATATQNLPQASCLAKICVSAAGALFNVLLAFVVALFISYVGIPEQEVLQTTCIGNLDDIVDAQGVHYPSPAKKAGLKVGDKILSIDSQKVDNFEDIIELIAIGSGRDNQNNPVAKIEVERKGKKLVFDVPAVLVKTNLSTGDEVRMIGVQPAIRMRVDEIMSNSPAEKAGLKKNDEVIGINSQKIYSPAHMSKMLETLKGKVFVDIVRDGKKMSLAVEPKRVILSKPLEKIKFETGEISLLDTLDSSKERFVKVFSKSPDVNVQVGDILYEVNSYKIRTIADIRKALTSQQRISVLAFADDMLNLKNLNVRSVSLESVAPQSKIMLGYSLKSETITVYPSVVKQFSSSVEKVFNALSSLINPKSDIGISSLAGPVDIGRVIYKLSETNVMLVLSFTVLLNINLAILNLLPIPVLDGGHIVFAIVEKIRRKPIEPMIFAIIQSIFTLIFLSLMAYVVYLGFMRWQGDALEQKQSEIYTQYYIKTKF